MVGTQLTIVFVVRDEAKQARPQVPHTHQASQEFNVSGDKSAVSARPVSEGRAFWS